MLFTSKGLDPNEFNSVLNSGNIGAQTFHGAIPNYLNNYLPVNPFDSLI